MVSLFDITLGFKKLANPQTCLNLHTCVKNLKTVLKADVIHLSKPENYFDGAVLVGAMECEHFLNCRCLKDLNPY